MTRNKIMAWSVLAGALAMSAWCAYSFFAPAGTTVEVVRAGAVIARFDLEAEGTRTVRVDAPGGGFNEILIDRGTVRIVRADCAGQACVKMGVLRSASLPLVCLPHQLTVRFADGGGELDGVAQ